jgi:hypothetical protein
MGSPDELKRKAGVDGNLENVFLKLTEGSWSRMKNLFLLLSVRILALKNSISSRIVGPGKRLLS